MLAHGPMTPPSPPRSPSPPKARNTGSRRIFPALFKLQVLDAYRLDHECKGNQRATARKFNVHRRQIQKWLQCETSLRASVADALRYDAGASAAPPDPQQRLHDPASRVYKHDARTLKLVAQKLYPSSYVGAIYKENGKGEVTNSQCFVPKEYQLNDTRSEAIDPSGYKRNIDPAAPSLILKKSVGGLMMCGSETVSKSAVSVAAASPARIPARPQPVFTANVSSPYATTSSSSSNDEPYNLVMSPSARSASTCSPLRPVTPVATAPSPLPARVAEIVADSKTSAFSPKRKWLQDSLQETAQTEPLPLTNKVTPPSDDPKPKKPCLDFSIERLCGSSASKECQVKTEVVTPPPPPLSTRFVPPALVFPPPLLMAHRMIPPLKSLYFRPDPLTHEAEQPEQIKQEASVTIKEESISDDEDEDIDVLSTSPCEDKSFEFPLGFPGGKRRSFSVQFKLNVLDAFHHDKECNQNQRATARKFNINRRQVQKWLSVEDELRYEGGSPPCAQCPHHCAPTPAPCAPCLRDCDCKPFTALAPYPPYSVPWIIY